MGCACRWNAYHCNVDENVIRHVAQAFHTYGLADVGYEFVNIGETPLLLSKVVLRLHMWSSSVMAFACRNANADDCWQVDRFTNGSIIPDPVRFPSGMAAIADYVHALGLKFGVYTAAHQYTCQVRTARRIADTRFARVAMWGTVAGVC